MSFRDIVIGRLQNYVFEATSTSVNYSHPVYSHLVPDGQRRFGRYRSHSLQTPWQLLAKWRPQLVLFINVSLNIVHIIPVIVLLLGGRGIFSYLVRRNFGGTGALIENAVVHTDAARQARRRVTNTSIPRNMYFAPQFLKDAQDQEHPSRHWEVRLLGTEFARIAITRDFGFITTRALDARPEDLLVMFLGAKKPVIIRAVTGTITAHRTRVPIRESSRPDAFRLVGPIISSIAGMMHIEVRKAVQRGEFQVEEFTSI